MSSSQPKKKVVIFSSLNETDINKLIGGHELRQEFDTQSGIRGIIVIKRGKNDNQAIG